MYVFLWFVRFRLKCAILYFALFLVYRRILQDVLDMHTLLIIHYSFCVFYIKDITTSVIASIDEMASPHLCRRDAPIPIYRYLKYLRRYLRVTNHSHVCLLSHLSKCSMQLLQGAINWRQGAVHQRPWNGPSLSIKIVEVLLPLLFSRDLIL